MTSDGFQVRDESGEVLATCYGDEGQRMARLFAQAPEMIAALKMAMADGGPVCSCEICVKARAIIAAVEGE